MHKVICEEPRHGRGPWKELRERNAPIDMLPTKQGMLRLHKNRKWFGEHLGPLRRWLRSQVGRPWNDVYSEACAVIKPDSVVRAHIKTHLLDYVERNTFMHDGKVCILSLRRGNGVVPVEENWSRHTRFYVHPETGLLCEIPASPRKRWRNIDAEKAAATRRWIGKNVALHKIRGFWFKCTFEVVRLGVRFHEYDLVQERVVTRGELSRYETHYLRCTTKHQLSHRDLRRYGLRNDATRSLDGAQSLTDHPRSFEDCASIMSFPI